MLFETIQAFKKGECRAMWYSYLNIVVVSAVFSYAANSSMVLFTVKHVYEYSMFLPRPETEECID